MFNIFTDSWPRTRSGYKSTAGTTASVVIIKNGRVYIAHCGDSSIALGSQTTDDECIAVAHMTEVCWKALWYINDCLFRLFPIQIPTKYIY